MRIRLCSIALFVICLQPLAQVRVSHDYNQSNQAIISVANESERTQSVKIDFTGTTGYQLTRGKELLLDIGPGRTIQASTLSIAENATSIQLTYKYTSIEGCLNPKIKPVKLILPISKGKSTKTGSIQEIESMLKIDERSENYNAVLFQLNEGDTVFTTRRGRVVKIIDSTPTDKKNLSFSLGSGRIVVEHKDSSFGQYSVLEPESIMVEIGDLLEAHTPIALAGGDSFNSGYQTRYTQYTYHTKPFLLGQEAKSEPHFMPIAFVHNDREVTIIPGNTYTNSFSTEHLFQEMSKREIKKWKKMKE